VAFKVLVSDPLADEAVTAMREAGLVVDVKTDLAPEALAETIPTYDALVVRSATKVRAPIIDAATSLKLIVRAGVGLDNIDTDYAEVKGIEVQNTPAASSNSVAELALGHLLSTARHIGRGSVSIKAGRWEKKALKGVEVAGKTLGIIGLGRIGQSLARKAAALGMRVIAFDKYATQNSLPKIVTMIPFEQLLRESDFISLHIPFDPKEGVTLAAKEFTMMKDGVRIINCARGGVVDERALAEALADGKVAAAACDVFVTEPPDVNDPLFAQENLSLTPHIGAATVEAQERVGKEAAEIVVKFAKSL
jgi:D-3-phosphoglycerate dehydrogenase